MILQNDLIFRNFGVKINNVHVFGPAISQAPISSISFRVNLKKKPLYVNLVYFSNSLTSKSNWYHWKTSFTRKTFYSSFSGGRKVFRSMQKSFWINEISFPIQSSFVCSHLKKNHSDLNLVAAYALPEIKHFGRLSSKVYFSRRHFTPIRKVFAEFFRMVMTFKLI